MSSSANVLLLVDGWLRFTLTLVVDMVRPHAAASGFFVDKDERGGEKLRLRLEVYVAPNQMHQDNFSQKRILKKALSIAPTISIVLGRKRTQKTRNHRPRTFIPPHSRTLNKESESCARSISTPTTALHRSGSSMLVLQRSASSMGTPLKTMNTRVMTSGAGVISRRAVTRRRPGARTATQRGCA